MDISFDKEQANHLLKQLLKTYNYSDSTILLFRKLTNFLTTVVQDNKCKRGISHENRLHDLLCNFSTAYVPIPIDSQIFQHSNLVNNQPVLGEGSNGRVYKSGIFQGNPIVTRTKKKWSNHTIYDIYINFVILNSFLLKGELTNHLIPSYGLFLCTTNEDGTQICTPLSKQKHLFLVQKEIQGKTLSKELYLMSLSTYRRIVQELFSTLIKLEESEFELYHSDLHCGNIVLSVGDDGEKHPVLLDFELCSFSVTDDNNITHRYRLNSIEQSYCRNEQIKSGAHDIILLFAHTQAHRNKEIKRYAMKQLQVLFQGFWSNIDTPFMITDDLFDQSENRWIYQLLLNIEIPLGSNYNKVHNHNMNQLRSMTYRSIYNNLAATL